MDLFSEEWRQFSSGYQVDYFKQSIAETQRVGKEERPNDQTVYKFLILFIYFAPFDFPLEFISHSYGSLTFSIFPATADSSIPLQLLEKSIDSILSLDAISTKVKGGTDL